MVLDGRANIGIGGPVIGEDPALERMAVGEVELVPVAAPSHALARMAAIAPGTSRKYRQLVLTDRSPLTEGRDFSVLSARTWRLADLGAKHALLIEGIGWGNMPRHAIADDLAGGRLVKLSIPEAPGMDYGFNALWRKDCKPGPARIWILNAIADRLQTECM